MDQGLDRLQLKNAGLKFNKRCSAYFRFWLFRWSAGKQNFSPAVRYFFLQCTDWLLELLIGTCCCF